MKPLRVLLVDDHPLFRDGIFTLLSTAEGMEVVGEAGNGEEAIEQARVLDPDLILMDIQMPGMSGLEATRRIKSEMPDTRIVMLTVSDDDEDVMEAVRCGAQGYLLKSLHSETFLELLAGLAGGEAAIPPGLAWLVLQQIGGAKTQASEVESLTQREVDVLRLVAQGYTNHQTAQSLSLSEHTVRFHLRNILKKLHAQSRTEAATRALREGLI
ncbi:MAG: response regulator [Anaerolineae bacterium]